MVSAETVIEDLRSLFKENFAAFVRRVNEEQDDAIIMEDFYSIVTFDGADGGFPCLRLRLLETEITEKDRIIENEVINVGVEIELKGSASYELEMVRYKEALKRFLSEYEFYPRWERMTTSKVYSSSIVLRIEI